MTIPLEFCAYRYLQQWERKEKPLHNAMAGNPSAQQIRDSLKHYGIARNFKGLKDDGIAEKISHELINVSDDESQSAPEKVVALASRFKEHFGKFNISAASKLLWLRNKEPYLIYDSKAINALISLGNKLDKSDYFSYYTVWQQEYKKRKKEITVATNGLVDLPRKYTAAFDLTDSQLTKLVQSKWFNERVFDIYLWEIG